MWLRAQLLATLLLAAAPNEAQRDVITNDSFKDCVKRPEQKLAVGQIKLIISTLGQQIASRLAAMEAKQAGILAINEKIDVAVSVLHDTFEDKLASLERKGMGEPRFQNTEIQADVKVLKTKVASLEKLVTDLTAKSHLPPQYQSDDIPAGMRRPSTSVNWQIPWPQSEVKKEVDQKFKNITNSFEMRLSQLESTLKKQASLFDDKQNATKMEQKDMREQLNIMVSKHREDFQRMSSDHNDTVSRFQSHVESSSRYKNEHSQAAQRHNDSVSHMMSYLQRSIQGLMADTNGSIAHWHKFLSSEQKHRVAEIEEVVANLTEEMQVRQEVTQTRLDAQEDDVQQASWRLNRTIEELTDNLQSGDAQNSAQLQRLGQSLRNLSALMMQHHPGQTTLLRPRPTYPSIPTESLRGTAIFVALRSNFTGSKIHPDEVYDVTGDFSASTGTFSPSGSSRGLFFHSISISVQPDTRLYVFLQDSSRHIAAVLLETKHDGIDIASGDVISNKPSLYLRNSGSPYSNSLMQTSWTAIGISDSMKRVIAFTLARTSSYTGSANPLPFQSTVSSVGGGISAGRDYFTVPQTGTYLFSVSMQTSHGGKTFQAGLMHGSQQLFRFARLSTAHDQVDTVSKAIIVKLTVGDRISVNLYGSDAKIYSNPGWSQASFSGFLYEPLHEAPVAWTVARSTSISNVTGHREILSYQREILNEGNAWNGTANAMVAPLAGYYYVHVSAGALPRRPVHLYVNINGRPFVDLWRSVGWHNNIDHLSRSALLRLKTGDKVQITAARGTGVHSDSGLQTLFCGFLAYRET